MRLRAGLAAIALVLTAGAPACGSDDPDDDSPTVPPNAATTLQPSSNEGRPVNPGVTSGGATGNNPPPGTGQPPGGNAGVEAGATTTNPRP